jgi:hypothetical protein
VSYIFYSSVRERAWLVWFWSTRSLRLIYAKYYYINAVHCATLLWQHCLPMHSGMIESSSDFRDHPKKLISWNRFCFWRAILKINRCPIIHFVTSLAVCPDRIFRATDLNSVGILVYYMGNSYLEPKIFQEF